MKIKESSFIFHCTCGCGKQFVKNLRKTFTKKVKDEIVNITETKIDCPFCHKVQMVKLIGKVEYFGDHNEYSKLHYSLKPVMVNGVWEYKSPLDVPVKPTMVEPINWSIKEEQWGLEEEYSNVDSE